MSTTHTDRAAALIAAHRDHEQRTPLLALLASAGAHAAKVGDNATDRAIADAAKVALQTGQRYVLAGSMLAKSVALEPMLDGTADAATLAASPEWTLAWQSAGQALRSASQGGIGMAAAKDAVATTATLSGAAEALADAIAKAAKAAKAADAKAKKDEHRAKVGDAGLLTERLDAILTNVKGLAKAPGQSAAIHAAKVAEIVKALQTFGEALPTL